MQLLSSQKKITYNLFLLKYGVKLRKLTFLPLIYQVSCAAGWLLDDVQLSQAVSPTL